ncbi:Senescence/spartin-associated [Cynara cardunculus var. scolymus]|uniref:Senescence/spartin-associated n=1 Tax=Cynara cardunculus var. scolymus TaxID=59895 RepID=A0A103Y2A8_CYNCS|nr:Senescence/spartin-associated [Cynara cardunculus var. scolymus]
MSCCGTKKPRTLSPPRTPPPPPPLPPQSPTAMNHHPQPKNVKHEILLSIPSSKVHLMDEGEAVELAAGDFTIIQISDEETLLANIIKVGDDLQWPLTKDEPVVKLDHLHYLFSLPVIKNDDPLSYGVSFSGENNLRLLDKFLKEHSCFSSSSSRKTDIDWKEFAPKVDAYNNFLAKAIAGGTGQIVKGIFICSNAYTNQVQKGGKTILSQPADEINGVSRNNTESKKIDGSRNENGINKSLKSVRKLSKMTESMSKAMLNGVGIATGSVMGPMVRSQAGKAFGESAGEATGNVLATAGHVAGTAWNVVKIRKAINPATSVSNGIRRNAAKTR